MKYFLSLFRPLYSYIVAVLFVTTLSRAILSLWKIDRFEDTGQLFKIFFNGFRIDVSLMAQLLLLPVLLVFVTILVPLFQGITREVIRAWLVFSVLLIVFMEIATPLFITQFDIRPNRLFVEYLNSPIEVSRMLMNGFLLPCVAIILMTIVLGYLAAKWIKPLPPVNGSSLGRKVFVTLFFIGLVIVDVYAGRSGFQHRPINPAMVAVSSDRLINSLALNSTYSVLYSLYQYRNESQAKYAYGKLPSNQMIAKVRRQMDSNLKFIGEGIESLHAPVPGVSPITPGKDLIMVVEESLGAHFVKSLGGEAVTPRIEEWRHKSWFFDNLYASGIRSARGLEAITTGFLPTASRAVLKLPKAQSNFFTLASYLKPAGYRSTFIYGGESHFDNMKGFFLSNGFDEVIDQYDFDSPDFMGSWGVSDEDLFARSLDFIRQAHQGPRLILVFSSSNHPPYEFPDNRIELFDKEKHTALNAGKYADYALGKFLDSLEAEKILDRSTLLVVADHEDSVYGTLPVPYDKFHIPAFILDPDIGPPRIDKRLSGQIDLAPTLVSLLGMKRPHPMVGRDLTHHLDRFRGRAIMQFGNNQAYMTDECIVYLQPQRLPEKTCFDGRQDTSANLVDTAIAHAQFAEHSYLAENYSPQPSAQ